MKKQNVFDGKIVAELSKDQKSLCFYWVTRTNATLLFSQKYTPDVYKTFQNGKRDFDLRNFKRWKRNPRLDKTISKIPLYIAFFEREKAKEGSEDAKL